MSEPLFNFPTFDTKVSTGAEADERLGELGIPLNVLNEALRAGEVAARQTDADSPKTAAGLQRWMSTVQALRKGMRVQGWQNVDPSNAPRVVNPMGTLSLAVVTGDFKTGNPRPTIQPGNIHPIGPTLEAAIERNRAKQTRGQYELASVIESAFLATIDAQDDSPIEWVLLQHRASEGVLRAEVSLPNASVNRTIGHWRERIVLPSLDFKGAPVARDSDLDSDDVDFDIREA